MLSVPYGHNKVSAGILQVFFLEPQHCYNDASYNVNRSCQHLYRVHPPSPTHRGRFSYFPSSLHVGDVARSSKLNCQTDKNYSSHQFLFQKIWGHIFSCCDRCWVHWWWALLETDHSPFFPLAPSRTMRYEELYTSLFFWFVFCDFFCFFTLSFLHGEAFFPH